LAPSLYLVGRFPKCPAEAGPNALRFTGDQKTKSNCS
jgi:hypothetical protein